MKKVLKIAFSVCLLTAYLFAANFATVQQETKTVEKAYYQVVHYSLSTAQDTASLGTLNFTHAPILMKISLGYFLIIDCANELLGTKVHQYQKNFLGFLIQIQKFNLIFPFHDFL